MSMYFTNSPYERMMMETPRGRPETEALPPGHPCRGCCYYKGEKCIGICWRTLLKDKVGAAKVE
jgi:hypothetical protein